MAAVRASLGIRVRSGTACAIVLIGPGASPRIAQRRTFNLCDPAIPASRQPYHAVMDANPREAHRLETELQAIVRTATHRAVHQAIADARKDGLHIAGSALVVGSQIDPGRIANDHIRAHAQEGQLFRTTLIDALKSNGVTSAVLLEREIYDQATSSLGKTVEEIKHSLRAFGRGTLVPWRAEEKLAALAAWMTLSARRR
jgi:hypothetical protein